MSEIEKNPGHTPPGSQTSSGESNQPATLLDFLKAEKAAPRAFLAHARKTPPTDVSESESEELGVYLNAHDVAAQRLAGLMAELRDEHSGVARQITRAAESYARRQLPITTPWYPLRTGTRAADVREVIRALLASAKDASSKKKAETAVFFVLWLARLRAVIDGDALAEIVLFLFSPESGDVAKRPGVSRDLGSILARVLHKRAARDSILETTLHFRAKVDAVTRESQALGAEIERLKEELGKKEQTIATLTDQASQDQRALREKEERIELLTRDVSDHRAVGRQSTQRVKARVNGLLQGELIPLVRDIHDSATMEPVRTHVILDRIETARKLIEREIKWLESSD